MSYYIDLDNDLGAEEEVERDFQLEQRQSKHKPTQIRGSQVFIHCMWCGTRKKVRQADINRNWGRFCNKSCAAKFKNRG